MPISSVGDYIIHKGHIAQEHRLFNQASGSIDVMQAIVQIVSLYHTGVLEYTFPAGDAVSSLEWLKGLSLNSHLQV